MADIWGGVPIIYIKISSFRKNNVCWQFVALVLSFLHKMDTRFLSFKVRFHFGRTAMSRGENIVTNVYSFDKMEM